MELIEVSHDFLKSAERMIDLHIDYQKKENMNSRGGINDAAADFSDVLFGITNVVMNSLDLRSNINVTQLGKDIYGIGLLFRIINKSKYLIKMKGIKTNLDMFRVSESFDICSFGDVGNLSYRYKKLGREDRYIILNFILISNSLESSDFDIRFDSHYFTDAGYAHSIRLTPSYVSFKGKVVNFKSDFDMQKNPKDNADIKIKLVELIDNSKKEEKIILGVGSTETKLMGSHKESHSGIDKDNLSSTPIEIVLFGDND